MSSKDFQRIDEVYHNMYKNKFNREEPLDHENGCNCDTCRQDMSSTSLQKKERAKDLKSPAGENAEETEDERYNREASEMEDARLKYYTNVYRKIQKGNMMIDDFIEWCTHQDVMPLKGEDSEQSPGESRRADMAEFNGIARKCFF